MQKLHAQARIELADLDYAERLLTELLVTDEKGEALGLLGRIEKQRWLRRLRDPARARLHLERAIGRYKEGWEKDTSDPRWHGTNLVALGLRAPEFGLSLDYDPVRIARQIVDAVRVLKEPLYWDLASAMECALAYSTDEALTFGVRYLDSEATSFAVASTARQLREVWRIEEEGGGNGNGKWLVDALSGRGLYAGPPTKEGPPGQADGLQSPFTGAPRQYAYWWCQGADRMQAIGRVLDRAVATQGTGTGFLVRANDLNARWPADQTVLVTNYHVVNRTGARVRPNTLRVEAADVMFELWNRRNRTKPTTDRFKLGRVVSESPVPELDYCIATVEGLEHVDCAMPLADQPPVPPLPVDAYVAGHARGYDMQVSAFGDAKLVAIQDRYLYYRASTEGGDSGSPIFDQNWNVIGLHHHGIVDVEGPDGWTSGNRGIELSRIRAALAAIPW
jgi:hypothetical protein